MGIKFKRQGGGTSCSDTAKAPSSLNYGEPAVDSEGRIYAGSGNGKVVSRVKLADTCTSAANATNAVNAERADVADKATRATFDLPLYKATFSASSWSGTGGTYTQTAACTAVDGGPAMNANMQPSPPMTQPTGVQETDELLQETLNIINAGTSTPGSGQMTVKTWDLPETDIIVYYYAR